MAVLAFDVYGTLFDLSSLGVEPGLLAEWRAVQLEMTWRATLMGLWLDFDEITRLSLGFVAARRGLRLDVEALARRWLELEPYGDARGLCRLAGRHALYVLTNGARRSVEALLARAGLSGCLAGTYTAEAVRRYKPAPEVYRGFMRWAGVGEGAYLVSSNPFDVAGAKNAGMRAIYLNRHGAPPDPLGPPPDHVVRSLDELERLPL